MRSVGSRIMNKYCIQKTSSCYEEVFCMGCMLPAMLIAPAMMTMFFKMYCPTSVGTKGADQLTSGSTTRGSAVVIMWSMRRGIAMRVAFGMRKSIPISISIAPKSMRNVGNSMKEMVCSKRFCTNASAGDWESTFNMPNQKNTTKSARRMLFGA